MGPVGPSPYTQERTESIMSTAKGADNGANKAVISLILFLYWFSFSAASVENQITSCRLVGEGV